MTPKLKPLIQLLSAALLASAIAGCGSSYVRQGHVGLLVDNMSGKIDNVLDPGFRMSIPFGQHIVEYPVIKQQYVMVRGTEGQHAHEDDSIKVNSVEGQEFNIDASVEYALHDKDSVARLYQRYGMPFEDIVEKYYRSKFRTAFANAVATLPLSESISGNGRKKVERLAIADLKSTLADDHIDILQVMVRGVYVPDAIAHSIADKTKAENQLVQARTRAQQLVVEAEAEGQAVLIKAKAEAQANKEISASLSDRLIRKLYVEKLAPTITMVLPEKSFMNFGGIVPDAAGGGTGRKK